MKIINSMLTVFVFAIFLSCKKPFDNTLISSLQQKWTLDSILLYNSSQFNGPHTKLNIISGYRDIRINGVEYRYLSVIDGGRINESYDTAYYVPKVDMKSIMIYPIIHGNSNGPSDSLLINKLTEKELILNNTTEHQHGFSRYFYHK